MLSIAQAGRAISACREPVMNTFPVLLGALCIYALAYRFYSAFIAAKALSLDDRRTTPAHAYPDGHNYVASPRCPHRIRCGTALEANAEWCAGATGSLRSSINQRPRSQDGMLLGLVS
jgi:hypothetical protein